MNPIVSIIVPIYNTEKYISKCLNSILSQTFERWEAIIVDDGSTDNSRELCSHYAQKDSRIRVIVNEHHGVSVSRNTGIKLANGEWITFVDADDEITEGYISNLLTLANKYNEVEFVVAGYQTVNRESGNIQSFTNFEELLTEDAVRGFFTHPKLYSNYMFFPYSKLYKKEIIKRYKILFDEKMSLGEDRVFVLQYLNQVHNVVFSPYHDYNIIFDNSGNSLSTKKRCPQDYFENFQMGYQTLQSLYQQHAIESIKKYIDNFIVDRIFTYIIIPFSKFGAEKQVSEYILDVVTPYICSINIQCDNIRSTKIRLLFFLLRYVSKYMVINLCKVKNFF